MIEQVSVFLENSAGRLGDMARALGDARIDMHALMVADTEEFGVVRIICDQPHRAIEVLGDLGFGASVTPVTGVEIPDRPGGLADVLEALGSAAINVEYAYCFVQRSGEAAVDVIKVDDARAEDVLAAAGFRVLTPRDLYDHDVS